MPQPARPAPPSAPRGVRVLATWAVLVLLVAGCRGHMGPQTTGVRIASEQPCSVPEPEPGRGGDPGPAPSTDTDLEAAPGTRVATIYDHLAASDVTVVGLWDSLQRVSREFVHRMTLVLPTTGILVEVHSDGPVEVDPVAFDQLVATITGDHAGVAPDVAELLACYHESIVDARRLDARRLRLILPSDPIQCLPAALLRADDAPLLGSGDCGSTGVTLPAMTASLGFPGLELLALSTVPTIVVAPGVDGGHESPARAAALVLAHELVHYLDNQMGNLPELSVRGMRRYERRAYWLEDVLDRRDADGLVELPHPIRYPAAGGRSA